VIIPIISASQSIGLATRLTNGWVNSSITPIVEKEKNKIRAESNEIEFLNERTKSKVITAYAVKCVILSRPCICNPDGITSGGRWVNRITVAVERTAITSHLILKTGLSIGGQLSFVV